MSNIDKVGQGVEIELGGKIRHLVFDMWAFYLLERETGKNALNGELFTQPSATELVTLVWAAVQGSEKLSMEQVGRMMPFSKLPDITKAIQIAFSHAAAPEDSLKKSPDAEVEAKPQ